MERMSPLITAEFKASRVGRLALGFLDDLEPGVVVPLKPYQSANEVPVGPCAQLVCVRIKSIFAVEIFRNKRSAAYCPR